MYVACMQILCHHIKGIWTFMDIQGVLETICNEFGGMPGLLLENIA